MLSRRGIGPVVPVPESAVDQFSGLSCARPQSGFAGKVSVLRTPLSSCPGLWPPSAGELGTDVFPPASAFRRRMFALSRSSCSSRSPFFENRRARPLHAFLLLPPFRGPLSIEAPNPQYYPRLRELARECPCGCVASVGGVFWCGRGGKQGPRGMPRGCFQDARPLPPQRADAGGNASAPSSPRKVATDQDSCSAASAEQTLSPQTLIGA